MFALNKRIKTIREYKLNSDWRNPLWHGSMTWQTSVHPSIYTSIHPSIQPTAASLFHTRVNPSRSRSLPAPLLSPIQIPPPPPRPPFLPPPTSPLASATHLSPCRRSAAVCTLPSPPLITRQEKKKGRELYRRRPWRASSPSQIRSSTPPTASTTHTAAAPNPSRADAADTSWTATSKGRRRRLGRLPPPAMATFFAIAVVGLRRPAKELLRQRGSPPLLPCPPRSTHRQGRSRGVQPPPPPEAGKSSDV